MESRTRQLHIWIAHTDYEFLKRFATSRDETIGAVVRKMIRATRTRIENEKAAQMVQPGMKVSNDP
jgi:hypothetical protein